MPQLCQEEALVAIVEGFVFQFETYLPRCCQSPAVHLLESMTKHRAVDLLEDIFTYLQDEIGANAQDVGIESRGIPPSTRSR